MSFDNHLICLKIYEVTCPRCSGVWEYIGYVPGHKMFLCADCIAKRETWRQVYGLMFLAFSLFLIYAGIRSC